MLTLSTLVLAILAQEPAPDATQAGPDVSGIQAAVQALKAAENYTFIQTTLDGGTPMGGAPGRGGDAARGRGGAGGRGGDAGGAQDPTGGEAAPPNPEPVTLTGHVQKGQPVHFLQGQEQAWRDTEGNVAYLDADGSWKALDPAAMRGAFGGRGGRGGGEDAQDPAAREAQRAQQQAMRARMGLMRAPIAHEVFGGLDKGVETVRKAEKGGKTVYSGTLSAEGAAAMAGGGMAARGGRGGRGGPGGNAMETSGAFTVVVGASGVVESVVVETVMKGSFGERTFERTRRMEVQIQKVGETTLEVPAQATEALKTAASARSARERGNEEF